MTQAEAYIAGWRAVMAGADPRYERPIGMDEDTSYAWTHGALDAMESEEGDKPEPNCAGY